MPDIGLGGTSAVVVAILLAEVRRLPLPGWDGAAVALHTRETAVR